MSTLEQHRSMMSCFGGEQELRKKRVLVTFFDLMLGYPLRWLSFVEARLTAVLLAELEPSLPVGQMEYGAGG